MKKILFVLASALVLLLTSSLSANISMDKPLVYKVKKLKTPLLIDANWDKDQWKGIKEIPVSNFMGEIPAFQPVVRAKMMYDQDNLYLIYKVDDRYIRIQNDEVNSPVSHDACVEFFFAPDADWPLRYFNLEINAGGTPLMAFHPGEKKRINVAENDFRQIEIAHTLPRKLEQEITEPQSWFLEFKLPLVLLRKYSPVSQPEKGVSWKANFYKTSSKSSNPHYLTWAVVDNPVPQFHLPQFFGTLTFD